jgi:hypothetical protein
MVIAHWRGSFRLVSGASFVFCLVVGTGSAQAQQLNAAPDGQQFQSQSAATQRDFVGTFGQSCAQKAWVWQHMLEVNADSFNGDPASDGQTFGDQDDDIQRAFVAWFGLQASDQWVAEHNAIVAHHVLLGDVAPVPCPPAASPVSTDVIGTQHLSDAVDAAKNGDNADAADLFDAFKALWTNVKPQVTKQSPTVAQNVQSAVDQVNALVGQSNVSAQVQPALRNLMQVVTDANTSLAGGGPAAATATGGAAVAPPQISPGNLGEAVDWASQANLAKMRDEFGQFQTDWSKVSTAWHTANPSTADGIDAAIAQLNSVIGDPSQSPPQSQYQPLVLALQKLVLDANASAGH